MGRTRGLAVLVVGFALLSCLVGCGGAGTTNASTGPLVLTGAGATAPYLAYSKWVEAYDKEDPATVLQYKATGSGDGIRQLESGAVDFAASDIPLSDAEAAKLKVKPLHSPTLVDAIVPVYNVPDAPDLKFTGEALASINSGAPLPSGHIVVVHRSDESGSTYAFTEFLSRVSATWKKGIGQGASVKWPVGQAAASNEAVAELVKKTPLSIGYVELNYAVEQKLPHGAVRNAAGKFQKPTLEAIGAAVDAAPNLQKDFRADLANAAGENAYPICTLTWLIVPSRISDPSKEKAMKRFLRWAYSDSGQRIAMSMDYGVLPAPVLTSVRDQIGDIH